MSAFMLLLLRHRQQTRSYLVRGAGGQDACVTGLFKSPLLIYPFLLLVSVSHGGRNRGERRCSSSSVWRRPSVTTNASVESGEAQTIGQVWEEYFADPSQWWDNRVHKVMGILENNKHIAPQNSVFWGGVKMNPQAPDFKHKVTKKALWVEGWSTPPWVKAMLKLVTQRKLLSRGGYHTSDSQEIIQSNRFLKGNFGTLPSSAREVKQAVQVGGGIMHLKSARTASEAIDVLNNRLQQGIAISSYMYVEVLKRCLKQEDLTVVKQVHESVVESGMQQNIHVANNLISAYIRCGRLEDACRVFDELVGKNVFSWTKMIGGFAQHNRTKDAMEFFNQMRKDGVQPDAVTYLSILKACASPSALGWGKEVHAHIRYGGLGSDVRVGTALLKMYAKCGSIKEARNTFDQLTCRDVISWNVMIGAYAEIGCGEEAYGLLVQMKREGFKPDAITFVSILNACSSAEALDWVKGVHSHAREAGFESDVRVGNALVHMYAKCGSIEDARLVFDRMGGRNVVTWNVMIGAYAESGFGEEAYLMFLQLIREGLKPSSVTYMNILNACAIAGTLDRVKKIHRHAFEAGYESDVRVGNALVHTYAKCGSIDDARLVFDRMEQRDVRTWTVMIGGLAQHGCEGEAYELLLQMKREDLRPDAFTYASILNACASTGALEWVKKVHSHAQEAGFESDLHVGNALVHMYAKCGSRNDARLIFDRMEQRDVRTWTVMIGACAESGRGEEAYQMFLQMIREGFKPDAFTYVSTLNACSSAGALEWVKEVHNHAREGGFEPDMRVDNALVHMYAKCGSVEDARLVFDRMEQRDVRTWTVMIGAYAESGNGEEAYRLFLQMKQEGLKPDAVTYVSILNASASTGALEWVKDIHSHARDAGFLSDMRLGNALVHMYAKCGSVHDARLVFNRMEQRDVRTWTVMIGGLAQHGCESEAYELLLRMKREGLKPDAFTYASILNACASTGPLDWVKSIHNHTREGGFESDMHVAKALVHMYAKCGSVDDARTVFDRIEDRDLITWTVMIGAYAESGRGEEAYQMFLQMIREGFAPNAITYLSILNACSSTGALEWVRDIHSRAREGGFESDVRVGNALVHMYAKCGSVDDARLVFDRMEQRDVRTWTVMIGGLAQHGCEREAYELLLRMKQDGLRPDAFTYASILNACASTGALEWVKEVHNHAHEGGFELDMHVAKALVHMYAKCGSINDARLLFDRMDERDLITWTVMIGAYAESGCGEEAYQMFLRMIREGFKPNAITYLSILNTCSSAGALEWVKEVHNHAREGGFESDVRVGNALVHMYAKCGSIDDARLVFDRMEQRDVRTWTSMIGGLAQHGCGSEALDNFRKMNATGVKPDGYSFVAVLSACSHTGLVDEGRQLFMAMSEEYGIVPDVLHCNCMVDILGRAGHLEEAKLFIDKMPVEPNGATWGALLGACRSYGNVELGELAAKQLVKLEPKDSSAYVLLSNIYAAAEKWEEASLVRTMMEERGIHKEPGRSWIKVDDKIHTFVVGDTSHPKTKEIYAELSRLTERIKAEGYLPDTRVVLHEIDEKDKEFSLCSHSEKLAIAYGLICSPSSKPIHVYKNLRVCSDCHTATKLISKVTRKEIVVRDLNRFHHFKDGLCSCKDYW